MDTITAPEATTYEVEGEVKMYLAPTGSLHGVHKGFCLKCGETEEWIAADAALMGTAFSAPGKKTKITL